MKELPTVPISNLKNMFDGNQIPSIEGVVSAVKEPRIGTSNGKDWWFQDFALKQGNDEIWGSIGDPKHKLDQSAKGKQLKLSCYTGPKGMSGVKLKVEEYNGQVRRKLTVSATANFEWGGQSSTSQQSSAPSPRPQQAANGPQTRNGAQVGNAINNAVLLITNKLIDAGEDALATVESAAVKILSIADRLEKGEVKQALGWKSFIHPIQLIPFSEVDEASKVRLIKWAFSNPSPKETDRILHANVLLMAAELNITQWGLLESAGASEDGFTSMIQRDYQVQFASDLNPEQWGTIFRNFDNTVKASNETKEPF